MLSSAPKRMACGSVTWAGQEQSGSLPFIADVTNGHRWLSTDSKVVDEKLKELGLARCPA